MLPFPTIAVPLATVTLPALKLTVLPAHRVAGVAVAEVIEGTALTVTVRVAVAFEQPPVPVIVYVIVVTPAATPLTTPVEILTVATAVLADVHAPPASPFDVKELVELAQTTCVPDKVPAFGVGVTVMVTTPDVAAEQPPLVTTAR